MNDTDEDRVYEYLEVLNRSGRLRPAGLDGGGGERGSHLAALSASDLRLPDDQIVLAAFSAIEQLSGWQASVEDLAWGSGEDLVNARESLIEIERLSVGARRALDDRLAALDAEGGR